MSQYPAEYASLTSVTAAASSTALLPQNFNRRAVYIYNDSSATLYLAYSPNASITAYTVQIPANGFFEMPASPVYLGAMSGIWSLAAGSARITELS